MMTAVACDVGEAKIHPLNGLLPPLISRQLHTSQSNSESIRFHVITADLESAWAQAQVASHVGSTLRFVSVINRWVLAEEMH